jgi:hypothetical protein
VGRRNDFDLNGDDQEVRANVDNNKKYKLISIMAKVYITSLNSHFTEN